MLDQILRLQGFATNGQRSRRADTGAGVAPVGCLACFPPHSSVYERRRGAGAADRAVCRPVRDRGAAGSPGARSAAFAAQTDVRCQSVERHQLAQVPGCAGRDRRGPDSVRARARMACAARRPRGLGLVGHRSRAGRSRRRLHPQHEEPCRSIDLGGGANPDGRRKEAPPSPQLSARSRPGLGFQGRNQGPGGFLVPSVRGGLRTIRRPAAQRRRSAGLVSRTRLRVLR